MRNWRSSSKKFSFDSTESLNRSNSLTIASVDEGRSSDAKVAAIVFNMFVTSSSVVPLNSKLSSMGVPSKNSWPLKCLSPSSTKKTGLQVYCGKAVLNAFERS